MNQQLKLAWHHRERERNTHTHTLFPIKATHTKALKRPKKTRSLFSSKQHAAATAIVASGLISSSIKQQQSNTQPQPHTQREMHQQTSVAASINSSRQKQQAAPKNREKGAAAPKAEIMAAAGQSGQGNKAGRHRHATTLSSGTYAPPQL